MIIQISEIKNYYNMERRIKEAAKELGVDRKKLIEFFRTEFNKRDATNKTRISDFEFEAARMRFGKIDSSLTPSLSPLTENVSPAMKDAALQDKPEDKASESLDDDTEKRIEDLYESTKLMAEIEGTSPSELTKQEQEMQRKLDKPSGIRRYLDYLESANKNLNGLFEGRDERERAIIDKQKQRLDEIEKTKQNIKEEESKLQQRIAAFEEEKKQFEQARETIQPRLDEVNFREQDLKKREIDIANKRYSEIILSLTSSMQRTQEDIQKGSLEWIENLKGVVKEFQEQVIGLSRQKLELEKKEANLAERSDEISAREEMLSLQLEAIEAQVTEDMERKYGQRIKELVRQNTAYQNKHTRQSGEIEDLERIVNIIISHFGGVDPIQIANELKRIEEENVKIKAIADSKIDLAEYDAVKAERDEALRINAQLKQQLSSERIEAVRQQARDADELKLKYKSCTEELAAAKASVKSLEAANNSLNNTISRLTEDQKDKENAFEYAREADKDKELNDDRIYFDNPSSLNELVSYVRRRMALGDGDENDGFYYDEKTIKSFIAGLHMSPITILQGISGTGKTSLPREFIKAITAGNEIFKDEDKNKNPKAPYRICAIQSGWRDNMDLMGYFNSFDCKYNETDFFKALYVAGLPKYKNTLFFIIMDEMNLSHPEHYFADFLSLLEQDEADRNITIKARKDVLPERIKGGLHIPPNVRFIGTANNDETTNSFAPKTYDRSNLIELPLLIDKNVIPTRESWTINYEWLEKEFKKAVDQFESSYDQFHKFIKDKSLIELLGKQNIGIGNRFSEKQAKRFIGVYMACGDNPKKDLAEAVDHLMTSRLLRVLENKYGLSPKTINDFRDEYKYIFEVYFDEESPQKALDLLNGLSNQKALDKDETL